MFLEGDVSLQASGACVVWGLYLGLPWAGRAGMVNEGG